LKIVVSGAVPTSAARRVPTLRRALKAALGRTARRRGELCLIFASDRNIRRLNREHLGHDFATDVISFSYPCAAPLLRMEQPPFGDVYVAVGVARRQAAELGHDLFRELLTLAIHGTLHLVGYDDKKSAARRRMFARQERIVRVFAGPGGTERPAAPQ